jgi:hypothetical protein
MGKGRVDEELMEEELMEEELKNAGGYLKKEERRSGRGSDGKINRGLTQRPLKKAADRDGREE